ADVAPRRAQGRPRPGEPAGRAGEAEGRPRRARAGRLRAHRRRASLDRRAGADVRRPAGGEERLMLDSLLLYSQSKLGPFWGSAVYETAVNLAFIVAIVIPLFLCVAYLTLWERKVIGWIQIRIGPNRVGPMGLLQPIADGVKLLFKEIILPTNANKALFLLAPVAMLMPALAAWAVIPFAPDVVLSDINAGLLYIMALSSMGVYGVIVAGWASNSKYAFLG